MLLEVPMRIISLSEDKAGIGKFTTENGPARATWHLSVPETTAKRAKTDYFRANSPNYVPAKLPRYRGYSFR